jgi:hypothetical protein
MSAAPVVPACLAVFAWAACVACSLDFDHYDPTDGGSDGGSDASGTNGGDSGSGGGFDSSDTSTACAAPQMCLTRAMSCASTCSQQYQRCSDRCQGDTGCLQNCGSQRQTCGGQCVMSCWNCAQSPGCPNSNDCQTAGTPP